VTSNQTNIYTEFLSDWLTHRRTFRVVTTASPDTIRRRLVERSEPPPADGNPFTVTTPIAINHSGSGSLLFEVNVARGLPVQEGHYIPFKLVGRATENEDGEWVLRGEVRPLWQGLVVYVFVLVALLMWVAASVTSAAVSPYGSYAAVWVSLGTTGILSLYMALLQWRDSRRLIGLLRAVTAP